MPDPVEFFSHTNTYVFAAQADARACHDCTCHISPPCTQCVECETCNPCWACDELHDGPRNDNCPKGTDHA
jgi:hypothetical protein